MTQLKIDVFSQYTNSNYANNVTLLGSSVPQYQKIGVGLLKDPSLMGVFSLKIPPPHPQVAYVNMISTSHNNILKGKSIDNSISLIPSEAIYKTNQSTSDDRSITDHLLVSLDP